MQVFIYRQVLSILIFFRKDSKFSDVSIHYNSQIMNLGNLKQNLHNLFLTLILLTLANFEVLYKSLPNLSISSSTKSISALVVIGVEVFTRRKKLTKFLDARGW